MAATRETGADDHILGFIGPRAEAEEIKAKLAKFLRETLGLELSAEKTLITHARSQPARFLGYDIIVQHAETKITSGRRSVNGTIALRVPPDVVKAQCARYRQHGKPWHLPRNAMGFRHLGVFRRAVRACWFWLRRVVSGLGHAEGRRSNRTTR